MATVKELEAILAELDKKDDEEADKEEETGPSIADLEAILAELDKEAPESQPASAPSPTPDVALPPSAPPPSRPPLPLTLEEEQGFSPEAFPGAGIGQPIRSIVKGIAALAPTQTEDVVASIPEAAFVPDTEASQRLRKLPAVTFSLAGAGVRELASTKTKIDGSGVAILPQAISEENPIARALALEEVYSGGEEFLKALEGEEAASFAGTGAFELGLGLKGVEQDMDDPRVQAGGRLARGLAIDIYVSAYTGGQFTRLLMPKRFTGPLASNMRPGSEFLMLPFKKSFDIERRAATATFVEEALKEGTITAKQAGLIKSSEQGGVFRALGFTEDGSVVARHVKGKRAGTHVIIPKEAFENQKVFVKSIGLDKADDIVFKGTDVVEITKGPMKGRWEVIGQTEKSYKLSRIRGKGKAFISRNAAVREQQGTVIRSVQPFGGVKMRPDFIKDQLRLAKMLREGKQLNRTMFSRMASEDIAAHIRGVELEKGVKAGTLNPFRVKMWVAADMEARTGIPVFSQGYTPMRAGLNAMMSEFDHIQAGARRIFGLWSKKMSTLAFQYRTEIQASMEAGGGRVGRLKFKSGQHKETVRLLGNSYRLVEREAKIAGNEMLSPVQYFGSPLRRIKDPLVRAGVGETIVVDGTEKFHILEKLNDGNVFAVRVGGENNGTFVLLGEATEEAPDAISLVGREVDFREANYIDLAEGTTARVDGLEEAFRTRAQKIPLDAEERAGDFSRSNEFKKTIKKRAEELDLKLPVSLTEKGTARTVLALRDDAEHLFDIYKAAYLRDKYLQGPLLRMNKLIDQLPSSDMRSYWKAYTNDALGKAAAGEAATQQQLRRWIVGVDSFLSKRGVESKAVATLQRKLDSTLAVRAVSNHMYKVFLGYSPASAIKNHTQKLLTNMLIGEEWTAKGAIFTKTKIGKRILQETGVLGRSAAFLDEVNAPLSWFSRADGHNRGTQMFGTIGKFERNYKRFSRAEMPFREFHRRMDMDFLHPIMQAEVLERMRRGQIFTGIEEIRQLDKIVRRGGKGREGLLRKLVGESRGAELDAALRRGELSADEFMNIVVKEGYNKESAAHLMGDYHQLMTQYPYEAGAQPAIFQGAGFGGLAKPAIGVFNTWWVNYLHLWSRVIRQAGRAPHRSIGKIARYATWSTATAMAAEHALGIRVGSWFGAGPMPNPLFATPLRSALESTSTFLRGSFQEGISSATSRTVGVSFSSQYDRRAKEQAASVLSHSPLIFLFAPEFIDELTRGLNLPSIIKLGLQVPVAFLGKPLGVTAGRMVNAWSKAMTELMRNDPDSALKAAELMLGLSPTRK